MARDVFCSHAGGSWTELYTNVTLLAEVDLLRHIRAILGAGKYVLPPRLAPGFIHEATHHWCLHTSVGIALAFLRLRAIRCAYATVSGIRSFEHSQILGDISRADAAIECLSPLLEGLALFAEYDVTPRMNHTTKVSLPMWWTHFFFALHRTGTVAEGLQHTLLDLRSTPDMERRRRGVLASPCTGEDGGYLPGYLAVKQIWLSAIQDDPRFLDRDLFMMFLKEYIFGDMQLVKLLLQSEIEPGGMARAIARQLEHRITQFWEIDRSAALTKFVAGLQQGGPNHIACGAKVTKEAESLLQKEQEKVADGKDRSKWGALCFYDGVTMARRDLMRLGSVSASASIDAEGGLQLDAGGEPLITITLGDKIKFDPKKEVTLDLEISPTFDDLFVTVWQDLKMVGQSVMSLEDGTMRNNSEAFLYVGSRDDQSAYYKGNRGFLDEFVSPSDRERLREAVRENTIDFLSEVALGQTAGDDRARHWATMAKSGVLALMNDNNDQLRHLSRIGLMCSISSSREIVSEELGKLGISASDISAIADVGQAVGVPMVILADELILTIT